MSSLTCTHCHFSAKNIAGFKSHVRACSRKRKSNKQSTNKASKHQNTCRDCDMLPFGSMQLVAVFLVEAFCLSAILFASLYNNYQQLQQINLLQEKISTYEN